MVMHRADELGDNLRNLIWRRRGWPRSWTPQALTFLKGIRGVASQTLRRLHTPVGMFLLLAAAACPASARELPPNPDPFSAVLVEIANSSSGDLAVLQAVGMTKVSVLEDLARVLVKVDSLPSLDAASVEYRIVPLREQFPRKLGEEQETARDGACPTINGKDAQQKWGDYCLPSDAYYTNGIDLSCGLLPGAAGFYFQLPSADVLEYTQIKVYLYGYERCWLGLCIDPPIGLPNWGTEQWDYNWSFPKDEGSYYLTVDPDGPYFSSWYETGISASVPGANLYSIKYAKCCYTYTPRPPCQANADFDGSPRNVCKGSSVHFDYDGECIGSGCSVSSCSWNFGDGGSSSTCGDVNHTYNSTGNKTVSLTVICSDGESETETKSSYIHVCGDPTASFTCPSQGMVGQSVTFSYGGSCDDDCGSCTCEWDFDDGDNATGCHNVSHTFDSWGEYNVCLTVENPCDEDEYCRDIDIHEEQVEACFDFDPGDPRAGEQVHFDADCSSGPIVSYKWYIDNDYKGSGEDFYWTFDEPGDYDVRLDVKGDEPGNDDSDDANVDVEANTGTIYGYVKAGRESGPGVPGVRVCANPGNHCDDTANPSGRFEIGPVEYGSYQLSCTKDGHDCFDIPHPTIEVDAPSNDAGDIVDCSTFGVSGNISYDGTECGSEGVTVTISGNSQEYNVPTDTDGDWSKSVLIGSGYRVCAEKEGHEIYPLCHDDIDVTGEVFDVDFEDRTTHLLTVDVTAGCGGGLGPAIISISEDEEDGVCITDEVETDPEGHKEISLPPMVYYVNYSYDGVTGDEPVQADMSEGPANVEFTHPTPLLMKVEGLPLREECLPDTIYSIQQGEVVSVEIHVYEELPEDPQCPVTGATVTVHDAISDVDTVITMESDQSSVEYQIVGKEVGSHADNYQRSLEIHVTKVGYEAVEEYNEVELIEVVVEGDAVISNTFTTAVSSLPLLILHDPSGDGSYSFLEKSCQHKSFLLMDLPRDADGDGAFDESMSVVYSLAFGDAWWDHATSLVVAGFGHLFAGILAPSQYELETLQKFTSSQSEDPTLIGPGRGDMFYGVGINIEYAAIERVRIEDCAVVVDTALGWAPTSVESDFWFSARKIREDLIPFWSTVDTLQDQADLWQQVLDSDIGADNYLAEDEDEHVSPWNPPLVTFDGSQSPRSFEATTTISKLLTFSTAIEVDAYFDATFGLKVLGTGAHAGVRVALNLAVGGSVSFGTVTETTVGFVLEDDDPSDQFQENIYLDERWGVPLFITSALNSSCPWEDVIPGEETAVQCLDSRIAPPIEVVAGSASDVAQFTWTIENCSSFPVSDGAVILAKEESSCHSTLSFDGEPSGWERTILPGNSLEVSITLTPDWDQMTCLDDTVWVVAKAECDPGQIATRERVIAHWPGPCPVPYFVDVHPSVVNSEDCPGLCEVEFYVNTDDDYSTVSWVGLERHIGVGWVEVDRLESPGAPWPNWVLRWNVDETTEDGEYEFRAVTHSVYESEEVSEPEWVSVCRTAPTVLQSYPAEGDWVDPPDNNSPFWVDYSEDMAVESFQCEIRDEDCLAQILPCNCIYVSVDGRLSVYAPNNDWSPVSTNEWNCLWITGEDACGNPSQENIRFRIRPDPPIPASVCFNVMSSNVANVPPGSEVCAIAALDLTACDEQIEPYSYQFSLTWPSALLEFVGVEDMPPFTDATPFLDSADGYETLTIGAAVAPGESAPTGGKPELARIRFEVASGNHDQADVGIEWETLEDPNGENLLPHLIPYDCRFDVESPVLGDVNCNGLANYADGGHVTAYTVFLDACRCEPSPLNCLLCGDVDGSGEIDIWDAALLKICATDPENGYCSGLGIGQEECGYKPGSGLVAAKESSAGAFAIKTALASDSTYHGEIVDVRCRVQDLDDELFGYTLELVWDSSKMSFGSLLDGLFVEAADSLELGVFRAAWSSATPIQSDTTLFAISLEVNTEEPSDIVSVCPNVVALGPPELEGFVSQGCDSAVANPSAEHVVVITPNGSETWVVGEQDTIRWSAQEIDLVRIEYGDGTKVWTMIVESVSADQGQFVWTVPDDPGDWLLRICDAEDGLPCDTSDDPFAIVPEEELTLQSPASGEDWIVGNPDTIRWDSQEIELVTIEYGNGGSWIVIASSVSAELGWYPWTVPDDPGEWYARICDSEDGVPCDSVVFRIVPPDGLALLAPINGEVLYAGWPDTIKWFSEEIESVRIEYGTPAHGWTNIAESAPAAPGSYIWTVPEDPGNWQMTLCDASAGVPCDTSTFKIVALETLTVLIPNGGEFWAVETVQSIQWDSQGIDSVCIEFGDGIGEWTTVACTSAAAGSYDWDVPSDPGDWYIRVCDAEDEEPCDVSDGQFSVDGDSTSPALTLGILQNPVLTEYLDVYLVASEDLDPTSIAVTVEEEQLAMGLLDDAEEVWMGKYELAAPSPSVEIACCACDHVGNSACDTTAFSATLMLAKEGGQAASVDGRMRLTVVPDALLRDGYILVLPAREYGESVGVARVPAPSQPISVAAEHPLLSYRVSPEGILGTEGAILQFDIPGDYLGPEPLDCLCIEQEGYGPLRSFVDPEAQAVTATIREFGTFHLTLGASGSSEVVDPSFLRVQQNFPNPFNPTTTIRFEIHARQRVHMAVHDVTGKRVSTLVSDILGPGTHEVLWEGKSDRGDKVAPGLYFCTLKTEHGASSKKMLLVR